LTPQPPQGINRGGDRQLNRALHTIVMIRERCHQPTRRYVARRTAEAEPARDPPLLKRTVARQLFRLLERQAPTRVTA
jgi:transposase